MGISPAAILYDASGNPVSIINDSGVYRLSGVTKVLNSSGSQVNPSTEDTLATRASEATLATRASEATLQSIDGKDFATETTLATRATEATLATRASEATLLAADGRLTTIDAVLDSIKDTDGIKKITDQLPAGTNNIGKTDSILHDVDGNPIDVPIEGNLVLVAVRDPEQFDTLKKILTEMRKTNFYLAQLLDADIRGVEVEGED